MKKRALTTSLTRFNSVDDLPVDKVGLVAWCGAGDTIWVDGCLHLGIL
jgi:hypothetical protein